MKNKVIIAIVVIIIIAVIIGIVIFANREIEDTTNNIIENETSNKLNNEQINEVNSDEKEVENMSVDNIKITINGEEFIAKLDNNKTVNEITQMLPLEQNFVEYASHEYYTELPEKPNKDGVETTSSIKAGHIYYWDGWNAFVINYEDTEIPPYQVVHIGEITDSKIIEILENADKNITIKVEK